MHLSLAKQPCIWPALWDHDGIQNDYQNAVLASTKLHFSLSLSGAWTFKEWEFCLANVHLSAWNCCFSPRKWRWLCIKKIFYFQKKCKIKLAPANAKLFLSICIIALNSIVSETQNDNYQEKLFRNWWDDQIDFIKV